MGKILTTNLDHAITANPIEKHYKSYYHEQSKRVGNCTVPEHLSNKGNLPATKCTITIEGADVGVEILPICRGCSYTLISTALDDMVKTKKGVLPPVGISSPTLQDITLSATGASLLWHWERTSISPTTYVSLGVQNISNVTLSIFNGTNSFKLASDIYYTST
ncbi:hypothetical protein NQ317_014228 [Molorchus minor]|uniref:Uncharacterized protein n=1 Tax=Molorchus minor TaxID=1323400 RepID=A0ABQ9JYZ9_9CUCU|nr:hypothetical protein NQ317_014228 [Molorchus minor]